jgi:hypothetical protein
LKVRDLVEKTVDGEVVLPDFQRSFVWEPENIRELLVSILGKYFIGSMLVLEHFKDDIPFAPRLVEGVKEVNPKSEVQNIVKVILDGQQRTTALFYALYEPPVPLKDRKNPYRFFINLSKLFEYKFDEAVEAVNLGDRRKQKMVRENPEYAPISLFKDVKALTRRFQNHPKFTGILEVANNFMNDEIHVVQLDRKTSLEKIAETFERINRTGTPLSIFDLLTARLWRYGINLRNLLKNSRHRYRFVEIFKPEMILKVVALVRNEEPKRRSLLNLSPDDFENDWETACVHLQKAYRRTGSNYGVLDTQRWMPYSTMIVPLATMLHYLDSHRIATANNYEKVDSWYWGSVFTTRYDQAVDTTSYTDLNAIKSWVNGGGCPDFIKNFEATSVDLDVDKQGSAIYRGVINLVKVSGAYDFRTGQPPEFEKEKIQDDHIFPKSKYKCNLVANRTLLSTNLKKSDLSPSRYFSQIVKEHGDTRFKQILETHLIPESAIQYLLSNDIENFIRERVKAVVKKVQQHVQIKG